MQAAIDLDVVIADCSGWELEADFRDPPGRDGHNSL
jgi:hypothetical protein